MATSEQQAFTARFARPVLESDNLNLRSEGQVGLQDLPIPTRRTERWKYSVITRLLSKKLSTTDTSKNNTTWPQNISPNPVSHLEAYLIIFRNGIFEPRLSDLPNIEGVICAPISKVKEEIKFSNSYHKSEWIGAMNATHFTDGLYLALSKNVQLKRPLIIHHLTDGVEIANFPRHKIILAEGAEAEVIVWSSATENSSGMLNSLLEASISSNAHLSLNKICNESGEIYHFSNCNIIQKSDSRLKVNTMTVKGHWVRNELQVLQAGKGTDSIFNGAYLPINNEHIDNHTTMDHAFPDGTSSEMYRGIMYGKSSGVFNGKVFVRPDAQRTNAYQQNSNIVADKGASINAKPELEIYADDVKCAHGCTVGQFDLEALFYLKSRGIDEKSARALLVQAFIADVLKGIANEELQEELMNLYSNRHGWL